MEKKTAVLGDTTWMCVDDTEDAATSLVANKCITLIRQNKKGDVTESYYFAPDVLNSIQFLMSPQPTRSY